jgi:hypothetical protein
MVNFNLTTKDYIHGLVVKLWSTNEQHIDNLDILYILVINF